MTLRDAWKGAYFYIIPIYNKSCTTIFRLNVYIISTKAHIIKTLTLNI